MKTVFKYPVEIGKQSIQMPDGAEILSVQVQQGGICLWALVDTSAALVGFKVEIVGTGHPANYSTQAFVGTVQTPPFVWHVFAWPERKH